MDFKMRFSEIVESKNTSGFKIFIDMDEVLVAFRDGVAHLMNNSSFSFENKKDRDDFWKFVSRMNEDDAVNFWSNLKWAPGGKALWNYVSKFDATILSSPGNNLRPIIEAGKWKWIRKHMSPQPKHVILDPDKWKYAGPYNILIDDSPKKYEKWEQHGGIAIPHMAGRDDHLDVIKQLQTRFKFPK